MASKRKLEEQRKKDEEERLARLHDDFVESFSDKPKLDKVWVKAGTAESERKGLDVSKREIYKPTSKLAENFKDTHRSKHRSDREHDRPPSKPTKGSKSAAKSNLEKFKEEIKAMQAERDERKKLREHIKECEEMGIAPTMLTSSGRPSRFEVNKDAMTTLDSVETDIYGKSAPDFTSDLSTTNIYCGNLNPKMTEAELCEVFGEYGPLASIKIMWPRTEEEKSKGRHSGFVGFMSRKDAEEAYEKLRGQQIQGFEMRLSWGKAIPIPHRPVYLPPSMQKETLPPPPSGLPFNAQPPDDRWKPSFDIYGQPDFSQKLDETDVKIVIPTERSLLCLIHRMVEYVVREGPLFEAMIMNRECKNPRFRFLFDNQTPAHCYYRWKLFSILQGDQPHNWNLKTFQMFDGGSFWIPPPMNPYMQKPNTVGDKKMGTTTRKVDLSERQREKLEDDLRDLTTERNKVGQLMVWCLEHADAAEQIVETITESLTIDETPLNKKLARLYVVNDLLHNSSVRLPNVSYFRKYFETVLPTIFESFNVAYKSIEGRIKAENFKQKILNIFRTWEDWVIYPIDQLIRCQNTFLGLSALNQIVPSNNGIEGENDVDGAPLSPSVVGQDVDGEPLAIRKSDRTDCIDGEPMDEDVDGKPLSNNSDEDSKELSKLKRGDSSEMKKSENKNKFVKTKWETVDDEVVKSQAITTSKWETLDEPDNKRRKSRFENSPQSDDEEDIDGAPLDKSRSSSPDVSVSNSAGLSGLSALTAAYTPKDAEKRSSDSSRSKKKDKRENNISRQKLRDIEMKVVKYQDELEAGRRSRKSGKTLNQQVQAYREKLINKELDEIGESTPRYNRDRSSDRSERFERKRYISRSPSPKRRRSPSPRRERYRSSSNSPYQRRHKSRTPESSRRRRSRSPRRRSRSRSSEKYSRSSKKSRK